MTFVADERARVPFALIAAVLLVTTLVYTSGFVHESPSDPVTPRVVETAVQEARLHLATAVRAAGRDAARAPVLQAGDSPTGALLAGDPFERALRLRIAVAARSALRSNRSSAGTAVAVSLPPITGTDSARTALEDVHLDRLTDDRVRVTVENVSVTARRNGHVVERDQMPLVATVELPVLAVHDRARTFERRLHANVVSPGLNRALTTRLFALAWVRGYAQYGGAPIANVVANRHVGLLTNDALVDQQAAAFGRADPDSRRALARAAAQVAVADGVAGVEGAITSASEKTRNGTTAPDVGAVSMPSALDDPQRVGIDRTADESFIDFVTGRRWTGLDRVFDEAYQARVRPSASSHLVDTDVSHHGDPPENGSVAFSLTTHDTDIDGAGTDVGHGSTLLTADRTVTRTETDHSFWFVNGSYAGATSVSHERTYAVTVDVDCRYARPRSAPGGRVRGRCPFGPAARDDLIDGAETTLRTRYGGADAVALDAAGGASHYRWTTVGVEPPAAARRQAYGSIAALRDTVRDIPVDTTPLSMASTANPASKLVGVLRDRHRRLVDAPASYDSAAGVASAMARSAYLDRLTGDLTRQSSAFAGVQDRLGDVMASHAVPSKPPAGDGDDLPPIASSIDAEPRYLSLAAREGHPPLMAARNVNLFTVPYGDVADTVAGAIAGDDDSASLATAASTLAATNRALEATPDPGVRAQRDRLRAGIGRSLATVRDAQRRSLVSATSLSRSEARSAVDAGYAEYGSVAEQASAVVEGSIADRIAAHLPGGLSATERDRALVDLRVTTTRAREDASVRLSESSVAAVSDRVRPLLADGAEQAVRVGTERAAVLAKRRAMRGAAADLPAGLPLLPIPGEWVATANVWVVSVRGGYERFTVRSPRATPAYAENGTIEYVRSDDRVTLDVDGDGDREVLGRNEPIGFSATTGVFVVVPAGPRGVGDTDGNADERSPGW